MNSDNQNMQHLRYHHNYNTNSDTSSYNHERLITNLPPPPSKKKKKKKKTARKKEAQSHFRLQKDSVSLSTDSTAAFCEEVMPAKPLGVQNTDRNWQKKY